MPKQEPYIKHDSRPEEKDVELSRRASSATLRKMEQEPGSWEKELDAPTEKESDEKFKEKVRELWNKLAVHGVIQRDKDGKVTIGNYTDLDGKAALGILKEAGIKGTDVEYINPGTFKKGMVNIDTGGKHGLEVVEDEDGEVTIFGDHHKDESGRDTSATKIFYKTMLALGMIEQTPALDKLVEFVTHVDNKTFPNEEKYFKDSWRTILGLQRYLNFKTLLRYFESGRSPVENLTAEELMKIRMIKPAPKNKESDPVTLEGPAIKQKAAVETSLAEMERLKKEGLIIPSQRYGWIVIDIGKKVPSGIDAAKYLGYDTYINWSPDTNGFFITSPDRGVTDTFSQGFRVRKGMYMKPRTDESPLKLTLGEVLEKMTDGELDPTGSLKDYLLKEKTSHVKVETIKMPDSTEKITPKKDLFESFLEEQKDKLADGEIKIDEFNRKKELLEQAESSDTPLETLKDALSEGVISPKEFDKLKGLIPEQNMGSEEKEMQQPEPEKSFVIQKSMEPAKPETTEGLKEKTKSLAEINNRIEEISRKLHDEVLRWSVVQELHKERVELSAEREELTNKMPKTEQPPKQSEKQISPLTDRVSEINKLLDQKYHALYKEGISVINRRPLEEEIGMLEKERTNLEKSKRGFSLWSWFKKRGKSLMEIPVRGEVKQAEMMRFGTKYASGLAEAYGTLVEKEDAVEISKSIREMAENKGVSMSEEEFKNAFDMALKKKIERNDEQIKRNVGYVLDVLEEQLAKSRGQATAKKVLTAVKRENIEKELTAKMNELRNSQISFDAKKFSKVLRNNLDRYWWLRYGYAIAEALTARKILSYVVGKVVGAKILPFDTPDMIGSGAGAVSPEQLSQLYMDPGENPWTMAKEVAKRVGLENPTAEQIQTIDEAFVKQNGIAVERWDIPGAKPDISLPSGWYLVSDAVKKATGFLTK